MAELGANGLSWVARLDTDFVGVPEICTHFKTGRNLIFLWNHHEDEYISEIKIFEA